HLSAVRADCHLEPVKIEAHARNRPPLFAPLTGAPGMIAPGRCQHWGHHSFSLTTATSPCLVERKGGRPEWLFPRTRAQGPRQKAARAPQHKSKLQQRPRPARPRTNAHADCSFDRVGPAAAKGRQEPGKPPQMLSNRLLVARMAVSRQAAAPCGKHGWFDPTRMGFRMPG